MEERVTDLGCTITLEKGRTVAGGRREAGHVALFTNNLPNAMRLVRKVKPGNPHINSGPRLRADSMPYSGLTGTGVGKQGPSYPVQDMTELRMAVFH